MELYYHFDIINSSNIGIGCIEKFGNINVIEGNYVESIKFVFTEDTILDSNILTKPAAREVTSGFDPLLLDPVVSAYSDVSSSSLNALKIVEEQLEAVEQKDGFTFTNCKCRKFKACAHDCFEITISNKFDYLYSGSDYDSPDVDGVW